jgi:hypothetical protein
MDQYWIVNFDPILDEPKKKNEKLGKFSSNASRRFGDKWKGSRRKSFLFTRASLARFRFSVRVR